MPVANRSPVKPSGAAAADPEAQHGLTKGSRKCAESEVQFITEKRK